MVKTSHILVIDDEDSICNFMEEVFTSEGYTVSTASEAEKGLQMAEELRPDVVLLDLKMPKMSGVDILRRIKAIDEAMAVIMMTGFGTMDTARAAMRLGAFDYVTKPFDLPHVKTVVKSAIAQRMDIYVDKLRSGKDLLSGEEIAFLDSITKCRAEGACVWEVVVRGLLLQDAEFLFDWRDEWSVSEKEREDLARLTQIVNEVKQRSQERTCV
jgi:DNA-binding NtrC family response regulator